MKYLRQFEEFNNNIHGWGLHLKSNTELAKYYTTGLKKYIHEPTLLSNLRLEDWDEKTSNFLLSKIEPEFHSNKYSTTYRLLSNKLGSDKETSNFLLELGIDGHRYKGPKNDDNFIIYDASRLNESIDINPLVLRDNLISQYPISMEELNYLLNELMENDVYIKLTRKISHKSREFEQNIMLALTTHSDNELKVINLNNTSINHIYTPLIKAISEGNIQLRDIINISSDKPFAEEVLPLIEKFVKKLNHFGYTIMQKEKEFSNRIPGYDIIVDYDTVVTLD